MVKKLPVMQKTRFQSLGWEDPLEEGMTTHSSILAWRTPWTEDPGGLQSVGSQGSDTTEHLSTEHMSLIKKISACALDQLQSSETNTSCPAVALWFHTHTHTHTYIY